VVRRQKAKGCKRPRAWHHVGNQDRLFAEADRIFADQPSITCPVCKMTSYNPHDIDQGYCGNCNDWTSPPAGVR